MRYLVGLVCVLALGVVACGETSETARPSAAEIEQFVDDYVADRLVPGGPGLAVAVMGPEGVVFEKVYGMADLEASLPVASDTPFELASVSKQFTATAVMILYEDGLLHPDDLVADYFPEAPPEWRQLGMTVHHLLTHQSGIHNTTSWSNGWTNTAVLAYAISTPLVFVPGDRYDYSNTGYVLLALLVERVTGQPFEDFLQEQIFQPLGMAQSSVPRTQPPDIPERARSYRNGKLFEFPLLIVGSRGQYSSLDDLENWELALRNPTVVSAETQDLMFTGYVDFLLDYWGSPPCSYGYGWVSCRFEGEPLNIHHSGWLWGYLTGISRAPESDVAVIMLSNGGFYLQDGNVYSDFWPWELTNDLYRFYLGLEPVTAAKAAAPAAECLDGPAEPPLLTPHGLIWPCD